MKPPKGKWWITLPVGALALAALVAPLFGRWFWIADLMSNFVPHYAVIAFVLMIVCFLTRRPVLAACTLAIVVVEVLRLLPLWTPYPSEAGAADTTRVKIIQFNVYVGNNNPTRVIDWVSREDPDVAVLVEVTREWASPLKVLQERYPATLVKFHPNGSGIAVLSRLPSSNMHLEYVGDRWRPTVVLKASPSPLGPPLALYATHLASPSNRGDTARRNRQLLALAKQLRADPSNPKILVGDLNTTRWSPWFGIIADSAGLRDTEEGFGFQPTWSYMPFGVWFGIPIDHLLVSSDVHVLDRRVGPDLGSDHRPVVTMIGWS